ncbi:MAG: DTW domain-containing protein [Cellvibrionaceae bacterium]
MNSVQKSETHFVLLTHSAEYKKPKNTGHLLQKLSSSVEFITWDRASQNPLEQLASEAILLFPREKIDSWNKQQQVNEKSLAAKFSIIKVETFVAVPSVKVVIIDATWQQAWKMYRQSPVLQSLPVLSLPNRESEYRLRRNPQGLSTAETAADVLRLRGERQAADNLYSAFKAFMDDYEAAKR